MRLSAVLTLIFLVNFAAQSQNGGSGYSRYGIGDLRYFSGGRTVGMGGASIGVLTPASLEYINPASVAKINRTRFSISTLYEGISTEDFSASGYFSQFTFNGAAVAIPVATSEGVVVNLGMVPLSRINYNVKTPAGDPAIDYTIQYIGDGGVSKAYLGSSVTIAGVLSVGARLDYYFGTLNYTTSEKFSNSQYTSAEVRRTSEIRGIGSTLGVIYTGLSKLLPENSTLNIGLMVSTTANPTATDQRFFVYNTTGTLLRDTLTLPDGNIQIPLAVGGGISYSAEKILLAADIFYQNWSKVRDNNGADLRDRYRYAVGGEIQPKKEYTAPFFQKIAYRLGIFSDATYYQLKGQPITETGLTFGFGIPVIGDTRLQLGAEYGLRGTTDNQLQKDRILRISLTLSGSELWFVRPEQE